MAFKGRPANWTVAPGAKPLPVIVKVVLPIGMLVGEIEVSTGTGFCSVTVDSARFEVSFCDLAATLTLPPTAAIFMGAV
ncbi:MAG: hypothetical protein OHK0021_02490 [Bryobacter sp.]